MEEQLEELNQMKYDNNKDTLKKLHDVEFLPKDQKLTTLKSKKPEPMLI